MENKTALNRMFINGKNRCLIILKDQMFLNNPSTRLLNREKNEFGRITKLLLDKIHTFFIRKIFIRN